MKKVAVVIPAYNEEVSIANLVREINLIKLDAYDLVPVVVNDCSKDLTAEIANNEDCILIDLPVNLGIGGAVQSGYIYAYKHDFDYAIQCDGDGQHPPTEIFKLLDCQKEFSANVVIGSRFIHKTGFQSSGFRRFGINYLKFLIKFLTKKTITDSTSGFRLLDKEALQLVQKYYPDEYPEPESLIYFFSKKMKVVETPVEMKERQGGISSISPFQSVYYIVKVSLAILFTFIRNH